MPKSVLIVEDEALLRRTLTTALREAGYRAIPVGSAEEAEPHLFPEPAADLVLLDNRLPKASGVSVLERLRENRAECSVILMTAYDQPEVRHAANRLASGYVLKPFDLDDMVRGVTSLLGRTPRSRTKKSQGPSGRTDRASSGERKNTGGVTSMAARKRARKRVVRKAARRKVARKAVRRKAVKKAVRRKAARKAVRRKVARKAVRRKVARKAVRRKVARKAVRRKVARKAIRRRAVKKAVKRKIVRKAVRRKVARAMVMGMAMDAMMAGQKRK